MWLANVGDKLVCSGERYLAKADAVWLLEVGGKLIRYQDSSKPKNAKDGEGKIQNVRKKSETSKQ